jgi:MoaA/NifB/PqqE/SkfB family radical SAM enzyme
MHRTVYSSLKVFHHPDRLQALAAGRHVAPLHVRLKPTNVCNHDCYFCAYRRDGLSLGSTMQVRDRIPRDKMREIVEDLIAMDVRAVTFSGGGEPLLYPWLGETLESLAAGGIAIGVLTNGAQLRGRLAETLARTAAWVRVSIDGWDAASYARNRNVPESSFEKVLANMAAFARLPGSCTLGASVIVDAENAPHLSGLAARLKAAGAAHVKLSPCIVSEDAAGTAGHHAPFADTALAEIGRCRALENDRFAIVDHYHFETDTGAARHPRCPMLRLLTVIAADGAVYACQDKAYTEAGRIGSIVDRRFRDLWHSDETQAWIDAFDARTCGHHCVAAGKNALLNDFLDTDRAHLAFV